MEGHSELLDLLGITRLNFVHFQSVAGSLGRLARVVVVVAFSKHARILREGLMNHSPPTL